MIAVPPPLKPEDCPLLKRFGKSFEQSLDAFNAAQNVAERLSTEFPDQYSVDVVQAQVARLAETRVKLTRERLQVGFLGPFQCGKSTTINNILRRKVSGEGNANACTSVVTRILIDPASGEPPKLKLRFFTVEEYQRRRNTLCEWARLPNAAGMTESQIVTRLESHSPQTSASSGHRNVLPDDIPYLRKLLRSYEAAAQGSRNPVRATPHFEEQPFDEKNKFLTHSKDEHADRVNPYLLLAEAYITISGGAGDSKPLVDPELELVDCPGLEANRSVDTLLTKEYIRDELDGAIVFLRSDATYGSASLEILSDLKEKFRTNFSTRVWVVFNKMDVPSRETKLEGTDGETTFDVVAQIDAKHKLPLSQVLMGCKDIYDLAVKSGGTADRAAALGKLKLEATDEPRLQEILRKHTGLAPAFESLLKDGGVGMLRSLLTEKIGRSVADGILAEGREVATDCQHNLTLELNAALKPASAAEQEHARAWSRFVQRMISELKGPGFDGRSGKWFSESEKLTRDVRRELLQKLQTKLRPEDREFASMSLKEFKETITQDASSLDAEISDRYPALVARFYQAILADIEGASLPEMELVDGKTPVFAWQQAARQAHATASQARSLAAILDREVLRRLIDPSVETGGAREQLPNHFTQSDHYQRLYGLLSRRVRAVVCDMSLRLRSEAITRLESLRQDVRRKLSPEQRRTDRSVATAEMTHA